VQVQKHQDAHLDLFKLRYSLEQLFIDRTNVEEGHDVASVQKLFVIVAYSISAHDSGSVN
jgi:hypothetical protein